MNKREKNKRFRFAKRLLNEQTKEVKVQKNQDQKINTIGISQPKLLTLSVMTKGINNHYEAALDQYIIAKKTYKEAFKNKKDIFTRDHGRAKLKTIKTKYQEAQKILKAEKTILKTEIKQINQLNKYPKGKLKVPNTDHNLIELKNVGKTYTTRLMIQPILKNINLKIKKGSFNVILGPSGSGKTTLLNMISGLDYATRGEIIIDGVNIAALKTNQLTQFRRKNIGFVFQNYNLLSSLNVRDNIELGRLLQISPHSRVPIDKLLTEMNMEHQGKKRTYELSGGQQQRVSIARAISKTPKILIGDEPTGALDQKVSLKIFNLFQRENIKNKITVIIVTHNENIAKLAHQVIRIKDGAIESIVHNPKPIKASALKEI